MADILSDDMILYDENKNLDDVGIQDVNLFRLEFMDDKSVWITCYREGKPNVRISLSSRGKIRGFHEYE